MKKKNMKQKQLNEDEFITFSEFKRKHIESDKELLEEYVELQNAHKLVEELVKLRKKAGMTQAEVALEMGVPQASVGRFEGNNVKNPTINYIQNFVNSLGYKISFKLEEDC